MTKNQQKEENPLSAKLLMFGHRLKTAREKAGLTQTELAEQFGTSQRVQSGYERGVVAPKVDYLFKLESLGINTRALLFDDQGLYKLDNIEQTIMDLYRKADEQTRLQVLGLLVEKAMGRTSAPSETNSNSALIAGKQTIKTIQKKS